MVRTSAPSCGCDHCRTYSAGSTRLSPPRNGADALIAGGVVLVYRRCCSAWPRSRAGCSRLCVRSRRACTRWSASDLAQRIEPASSDELYQRGLARDFNHLAQTLGQHRDARRHAGRGHRTRTAHTACDIARKNLAALLGRWRCAVRRWPPFPIRCRRNACLSSLVDDLYTSSHLPMRARSNIDSRHFRSRRSGARSGLNFTPCASAQTQDSRSRSPPSMRRCPCAATRATPRTPDHSRQPPHQLSTLRRCSWTHP